MRDHAKAHRPAALRPTYGVHSERASFEIERSSLLDTFETQMNDRNPRT
jgi:hypothetical protein